MSVAIADTDPMRTLLATARMSLARLSPYTALLSLHICISDALHYRKFERLF
jgi:hypothetical protein